MIHYHCKNGLNDRWKDFHESVLRSYNQKRLILIHWPDLPLEQFLVPNLVNWTLPTIPDNHDSTTTSILNQTLAKICQVETHFVGGVEREEQ